MKVLMRKYLINKRIWTLFWAFLVVLPAPVGFVSAQQTEDPLDRLFTIRAVKVDETAARASEARRVALAKVEIEAYEKLLSKITQPDGRARLPDLDAASIQSMISGIEVVDEQSSSRRYLATLDVRFEPGLVSAFLAEYSVPHVLGTGRGILIFHAHQRGLEQYLWQPSDAVMDARGQVDWLNRIRRYVFPRGEMAERAAITFGDVSALRSYDTSGIVQRYDVRAALLISSEWNGVGPNRHLAYRFLSTDEELQGDGVIAGHDNETAALAAMYVDVQDRIDSAWRSQLLVDTGTGGELTALVTTTDLSMLAVVRDRLIDVSLVNNVRTLEIGLPFSKIRFDYTGREDQLILALRYAGLNLSMYGDDRLIGPRSEEQTVVN